jgi:hypothetical protein
MKNLKEKLFIILFAIVFVFSFYNFTQANQCTDADGTVTLDCGTLEADCRDMTCDYALEAGVTATNCTIPAGRSTCTTNVNWYMGNVPGWRYSVSDGYVNRNGVRFGNGTSGSKSDVIPYGNSVTYRLYLYTTGVPKYFGSNPAEVGSARPTASCVSGTTWNGTICIGPSGTLSATSCTIPVGSSTCASTLNWSLQNIPPGNANEPTEVTRNNPANTHVSFATSGSNVSNSVNFGASSFFLYHSMNGVPTEFARANITADCATGGVWDSTQNKCISNGVPSGQVWGTSCTIPVNGSTCGVSVNWTTANLTSGVTEITRNNPANTHVSFNTSGTNFNNTINFGQSTFYLYHNINGTPTILSQYTADASCATGSSWDGTKCLEDTSTSCTGGRVWNGSACVCPVGSTWDGTQCVPEGGGGGGGGGGSTVTVTLTANPVSIFSGSSSTLTWTSTDAASCSAGSPAVFNPTLVLNGGPVTVKPLSTTTYSITCSGVTAEATITVKKKPIFIED